MPASLVRPPVYLHSRTPALDILSCSHSQLHRCIAHRTLARLVDVHDAGRDFARYRRETRAPWRFVHLFSSSKSFAANPANGFTPTMRTPIIAALAIPPSLPLSLLVPRVNCLCASQHKQIQVYPFELHFLHLWRMNNFSGYLFDFHMLPRTQSVYRKRRQVSMSIISCEIFASRNLFRKKSRARSRLFHRCCPVSTSTSLPLF